MIGDGPSILRLATYVNGYGFGPEDLNGATWPVVRIRHLLDSTIEPDRTDLEVSKVRIEDDDLIFSWSATLAVRVWQRGPALLNQHLFRVDPAPGIDRGWLFYALTEACRRLEGRMHGSAMTHITRDMMREVTVAVPRKEDQRAIADYLDTETARIDALIARKQRMRELLSARPWRWFESMVERCDYLPLRRLLRSVHDGPFGSAFSSSDYSEDGAAVVRLGNIGFAEFRIDDLARIPMAIYHDFERHRVVEGDLLVAALGDDRNHAGRACVAPDLGPTIVKGKCLCASVNVDVAEPWFLAYFLSSGRGAHAIRAEARGSTRQMINLEIIKSLEVPELPLVQQQRLAAEMATRISHTSRLIDRLAASVVILRERRQALITAMVTGELEVPGVAA